MLLNILDQIFEDYVNIAFFVLNTFLLIVLLVAFFSLRDNRKRRDKLNDYLLDVTKTVDSVRYGDLTKKINKIGDVDSKNLAESINRMIETLHDRELMINEFHNDLIRQNIILERTLNSLSDGLLVIDENNKILRITNVAAKWFNTDGKDLIGKHLQDYVEIPRNKEISFLDNDEVNIPAQGAQNFTISSVELKLEEMKDKYLIIIKNITAQKELETV